MPLILFVDADTKKATSKIKQASKQAGKDVKQLETKSVSSAAKMTASFKRLAGIAGIGGVSFALKAAIGQLFKFETALAEVSTLVDTSVVSMRGFNVEILKLTTGIPQTATQITKGLYEVISAGVTDASDALFVLEVSAKAATGGLTNTNIAVDAITTILNAYQKSAQEAVDVSDVLFTTVRLGKTRFEPLANSIGIVATSASLAGVRFEELGAAIGTMTKFGIGTEITVTALNRLFLQIVNPTTQLKEKSKELGVEFSAAALRTKGFSKFMGELTEKFEEDQDAIFALGLDLRAFRALAILGGKGAAEFSDQLLQMKDRLNAAEVAFEKINKTAEAQAQILKNKLNVDLQELGRVVLPVVVFGFDALLFAMSPVNSMLNTYDKAIADAKKRTDDIVPTLGGFATAMLNAAQAQAAFLKAGEQLAPPEAPPIPFVGLEPEIFEDIIPPMSEVIAGLGEAETITEKWLKLQEAIALEIPKLPENIRIVNIEQERALALTKDLASAFGQAVANSESLLDIVKEIAKQLAIKAFVAFITSQLPGSGGFAQQFFGFAHGTNSAPGGLALVGERGPEIVNLPRGSQVIPNNQINNNFSTNNSFTLVFPAVRELDDFELQTNVIPKINALVQRGDSRLSASEIV